MAFNPNTQSFADGVARVKSAQSKSLLKIDRIVTSKDKEASATIPDLILKEALNGFNKWLLPVYMDGPALLSFSYGAPDIDVPKHSHNEGDGFRLILHGSIIYNGTELAAGDWMFLPKGLPYEFKVGPKGVGMFYCYQCCCV